MEYNDTSQVMKFDNALIFTFLNHNFQAEIIYKSWLFWIEKQICNITFCIFTIHFLLCLVLILLIYIEWLILFLFYTNNFTHPLYKYLNRSHKIFGNVLK